MHANQPDVTFGSEQKRRFDDPLHFRLQAEQLEDLVGFDETGSGIRHEEAFLPADERLDRRRKRRQLPIGELQRQFGIPVAEVVVETGDTAPSDRLVTFVLVNACE